MGSSKKTTNVDMGPWKPIQSEITGKGLPALEQAYGAGVNDPQLAEARQYSSDVMSGKFLDPASNPALRPYLDTLRGDVTSGFNTLAARSGRGNMTGGDLQQQLARGMTAGLAQPLLQTYGAERNAQQGMASMAPQFMAAGMQPGLAYAGGLRDFGALGKAGTVTEKTSGNPFQSILGGIGMAANLIPGMGGMFGGGAMPFTNFMQGGGSVSGYQLPFSPMSELPWLR